MADAADLAVQTILGDAGIGLTLDEDLFRGEVKPFKDGLIPYLGVWCLLTGGPTPRSQVNSNLGPDLREPTVQVRIRGNPIAKQGAYKEAQDLAEACWTALQRATHPGFMSLTIRESAAEPLGQDDTDSPEFSFNVETMLEQA